MSYESTTTIYNKDDRIDKCVTCITIILGFMMLVAPLWWLQKMTTDESKLSQRLAIITGFLALFVGLTSIVSVAKPFEVLAAAAAYSAVLMVFMQLGSSSSHGAGALS